jgi:RimJ/RimL family protein N-acetyltransferase
MLRIYTERLCLRSPTREDAVALYDLLSDATIMRALNREPVSAPAEGQPIIDSGIRSWETDGLGPFIIETVGTTPQVVGQAGLMIFDARDWTSSTWANAGSHAQPELGWALIRAHWGRGYATEAAAAIQRWAYEQPAIERLVSLISTDNVRSQRVAKRLDATPTDTVISRDSGAVTVVWEHPTPRRPSQT